MNSANPATPAPRTFEASNDNVPPIVTPSTPVPRPAQQPPTDEPKADPAELARRYQNTSDPQERGEIIDELWTLDSVASINMIRQLFVFETNTDVKVDIVAGLNDSTNPKTREARFGLIVTALAPTQPKDLREIAAQMLIEYDDPRAAGLLQQYSQDPDPEVRDAVREALEMRKEMEEK